MMFVPLLMQGSMQSIEARSQYKNSFNCAVRIFKEESLLAFWSGAVPRLVRLSLSGGIVFTMYVFICTKFGRYSH